jgi:hypothetical protein
MFLHMKTLSALVLGLVGVIGCSSSTDAAAVSDSHNLAPATMTPGAVSIHLNDTTRFLVSSSVPGVTSWQWRVGDTTVVTVDSTGLARGRAPGSTVVIATATVNANINVGGAITVSP